MQGLAENVPKIMFRNYTQANTTSSLGSWWLLGGSPANTRGPSHRTVCRYDFSLHYWYRTICFYNNQAQHIYLCTERQRGRKQWWPTQKWAHWVSSPPKTFYHLSSRRLFSDLNWTIKMIEEPVQNELLDSRSRRERTQHWPAAPKPCAKSQNDLAGSRKNGRTQW